MIVVNLVGGLGNQLFQISAAQAMSVPGEKVILEYGLGSTRLLPSGEPEIAGYKLPNNFRLSKREGFIAKGISKVIGFTLRLQQTSSKNGTHQVASRITLNICQIVLLIYYRRPLSLICPSDLGYFEIDRKGDVFLSGYFQSYFWPESIFSWLEDLVAENEELEVYRGLALIENPIIVHVRRGDYRQEDTFGLLGINYYSSALNEVTTRTESKNIWLFSDEPKLAIEILQVSTNLNIRVIPEMDLNSAQMLEIMKLGTAYIIANSTYSWWAAFLSKSKLVVAPDPWFKAAVGPSKLFPNDWKRVKSSFE